MVSIYIFFRNSQRQIINIKLPFLMKITLKVNDNITYLIPVITLYVVFRKLFTNIHTVPSFCNAISFLAL